jgi:hypothetical protein
MDIGSSFWAMVPGLINTNQALLSGWPALHRGDVGPAGEHTPTTRAWMHRRFRSSPYFSNSAASFGQASFTDAEVRGGT